jgi:hypothetical protein
MIWVTVYKFTFLRKFTMGHNSHGTRVIHNLREENAEVKRFYGCIYSILMPENCSRKYITCMYIFSISNSFAISLFSLNDCHLTCAKTIEA